MPEILKNSRVLIVGCGVTGASVARFLYVQGVPFDLVDEGEIPTEKLAQELAKSTLFSVIDTALLKQYDVLVLSPGIARSHRAVSAAIKHGVSVIGDLELFAQVVAAPVIAVTGSNGKSTVVAWLSSVANAVGVRAVPCGNIGEPALDALDKSVELYVLELSSYQLESTLSLHPLCATVLNISDDHLDRYASIEDYASVKRGIYKGAAWRVLNSDDSRTWPAACNDENVQQACFSLTSGCSANMTCWHRGQSGSVASLCRDSRPLIAQESLRLPGDHNIANALAVLALLEPLNLALDAVLAALVQWNGLPHRTEYIAEIDGVRWYNDSKGTNVNASVSAVLAMPGPVVMIAGGIGKGADFSPLRGAIEAHVHTLVLIGRDAGLLANMLEGCADIVHAETLQQAVSISAERARAGDVVLLSPACSSFDMFENFIDRGEQFTAAVRARCAA
ncbi:MAG: UDP-N-acetylmuramoyl-L-alanine--D-glutamate ligase [Granulosicoccus sp.]